MTDEKTQLLRQLDDARDYLWGVLAPLDPAFEIYPGWKKREFFAHIAGWEASVFATFRDYLAGLPYKPYPYANLTDVDAENADFVAGRQSSTVEAVKLECEINRFALKTLLLGIPAEDFEQPISFPWGTESFASFVRGAITHELEHADEISAMTQQGS